MTSKAILAGAAMAGLMSGSFAVQAHATNVSGKAGVSLSQMGKKDVHACKGQNSCKGKGGQRWLQDERQRLQRKEFLQRKGRLRDGRQQASSGPVIVVTVAVTRVYARRLTSLESRSFNLRLFKLKVFHYACKPV
jgi:hypothetical protein